MPLSCCFSCSLSCLLIPEQNNSRLTVAPTPAHQIRLKWIEHCLRRMGERSSRRKLSRYRSSGSIENQNIGDEVGKKNGWYALESLMEIYDLAKDAQAQESDFQFVLHHTTRPTATTTYGRTWCRNCSLYAPNGNRSQDLGLPTLPCYLKRTMRRLPSTILRQC